MNYTNPATDFIATGTAGILVVGTSMARLPDHTRSLLDASLEQIINGEFTWHGSDITAIIGSVFLVAGFYVSYKRLKIETNRHKPDELTDLSDNAQ